MGGDRSASSAAQGATHHRTALAAHGLAEYRASRSADTATQKGRPFVRMGGMDQSQKPQGGGTRTQGASQLGRKPGGARRQMRHMQQGPEPVPPEVTVYVLSTARMATR